MLTLVDDHMSNSINSI